MIAAVLHRSLFLSFLLIVRILLFMCVHLSLFVDKSNPITFILVSSWQPPFGTTWSRFIFWTYEIVPHHQVISADATEMSDTL